MFEQKKSLKMAKNHAKKKTRNPGLFKSEYLYKKRLKIAKNSKNKNFITFF